MDILEQKRDIVNAVKKGRRCVLQEKLHVFAREPGFSLQIPFDTNVLSRYTTERHREPIEEEHS
jgi:hypothetical protein